jgi:alpha-glucosidase (family GH31 glycosyl hydrolase)
MTIEPDGNANGLFLLNSNAMGILVVIYAHMTHSQIFTVSCFFFSLSLSADIILQPYKPDRGAITFRTIGGVIDFFFYAGPSPNEVAVQHISTIGRPAMVPFWSLGYVKKKLSR